MEGYCYWRKQSTTQFRDHSLQQLTYNPLAHAGGFPLFLHENEHELRNFWEKFRQLGDLLCF